MKNLEVRTDNYSVFVGGVEVTDFLLTKKQAENLAEDYRNDGYDDVQVYHY